MAGVEFKDSIEITVSKELKLFVRSMTASYKFIFQQEKYDFVQRADMLELVEKEKVGELSVKFLNVAEGQKLMLSRQDLYLFYTMMELVCRSFLCEIGDDYKAITMKLNRVNDEHYNAVRSTELSIAQTLIQQIKRDFSSDPEFEEILDRLDVLGEP